MLYLLVKLNSDKKETAEEFCDSPAVITLYEACIVTEFYETQVIVATDV